MNRQIIQFISAADKETFNYLIDGLELLDAEKSISGDFTDVMNIREIKKEMKELVPNHKTKTRK
jgi:hypothetical protein